MEWDKGHRSEHGQKGWVALRDLGSKFGSPSTLGSLASSKAKGRGSPMGGEVTGMGGGRALGASSSHVPPAPGLHPNPGSTERRVPTLAPGQAPSGREPAEGKSKQN